MFSIHGLCKGVFLSKVKMVIFLILLSLQIWKMIFKNVWVQTILDPADFHVCGQIFLKTLFLQVIQDWNEMKAG